MKEFKAFLNPKIYGELPLDVCMNLNFNWNHVYMIAYTKTKVPPKFCNPWGATSMCEQISIDEKRCNMTCYFTQQVKRSMMAKISK